MMQFQMQFMLEQQKQNQEFMLKAMSDARVPTPQVPNRKAIGLDGERHAVTDVANVVGKLTYSLSASSDQLYRIWDQWWFKYSFYLNGRSQHSEKIIEKVVQVVKTAVGKYHGATNPALRAQVAPDHKELAGELDRHEADHCKRLAIDTYSLFPVHCQKYARDRQKELGTQAIALVDLLYLPMRDLVPRDALDRAQIAKSFVDRSSSQAMTEKNCLTWLGTWKTRYDDLVRGGYISATYDHTELFRVLRAACENLFGKGTAMQTGALVAASRDFFKQRPIPVDTISSRYMIDYFWTIKGEIDDVYRNSGGTAEVHWGEVSTKKPKDPPKDSPQDPPKDEGVADKDVNVTEGTGKKKKDRKKKEVADVPDQEANATAASTKPPDKDKSKIQIPRMPKKREEMKPADWKQHFTALKKAYEDNGRAAPVCIGFHLYGDCNCQGVLSHKVADYDAYADRVKAIPCRLGDKCKPRLNKPPLKVCPHMHKKEVNLAEADEHGDQSVTPFVACDAEVHRAEVTRLLFDECANTNVASTFEVEVKGRASLGTAHGTATVNSGTATIGGNELEFIQSVNGKRDILSATQVFNLPQVVGYYRCNEAMSIKPRDGNVVVVKGADGQYTEFVLERNERGFPTITSEQYAEIIKLGEGVDGAENLESHWSDVVGQYAAWEKLPEASASMWTKEILRALGPEHPSPVMYWTNTTGHRPPPTPAGDVVVLDLELGRHGVVTMLHDVTREQHHEELQAPRGPALAAPWKMRVVRIVLGDASVPVPAMPVVGTGPTTGSVQFARVADIEAHFCDTDNIQYFDAQESGGIEYEITRSTTHACSDSKHFLSEDAEVHVVTRSKAAQETPSDTWFESEEEWVRCVNQPTTQLFVPTERNAPFDLKVIGETRRTVIDGEAGQPPTVIEDNWKRVGRRTINRSYTGRVFFLKIMLLLAAAPQVVQSDAQVPAVSGHYPGNLGGLPGDGNLFQPPAIDRFRIIRKRPFPDYPEPFVSTKGIL